MNQHILNSISTSLIDSNIESIDELRPKMLINDYKKGSKVLTSVSKQLKNCDEFIFSVAFVTMSGVTLILETLKELENKGIKGKILTTDYLNFSDPKALKKLLEFKNLEVKVYTKQSFHTKGYIFKKDDKYTMIIGSSNLTQTALSLNKEWNIQLTSTEKGGLVNEVLSEFDLMWNEADIVSDEWLSEYELIHKEMRKLKNIQTINKVNKKKLSPNKMQIEAISALDNIRKENKDKALLISATGTGKTYLSAFDVENVKPKKLLFLVHREQILKQAMRSFKNVLGNDITMGILSGNQKDTSASYLFSTVQMMSKESVHETFSKDHFDYIIIDESHKAGSSSYLKIMNYFTPKFLLGMTATPERTDGFNIYELFDYNVAYEIRLQRAMEEDLLCPFHYFGVTDLSIDGNIVEDVEDFSKLVSNERVNNIIDKINFYGYSGDRVKGLMFCSRKQEAMELSKLFNERGYKTVALCGDSSEDEREKAISMLENDNREEGLDYIFTVDIFNEGVDIPAVNQVVMLRPTQSSIVFVQQLGRGLRKDDSKEYVVIIDFIGNYKKNFLIPIALSGDRTYNKDTIRKYVAAGNNVIPGCSTVNFDKISKERIYESINNTNFKNMTLLKEEYSNLKNRLGKIPMITDFYENASIDPMIIIEHSKNYYDFLKKIEKSYDKTISDKEKLMLEFVSMQLSSGKRPHELILLNLLLNNESVSIDDFKNYLSEKFNIVNDDKSVNNAINALMGEFMVGTDKKKYGDSVFVEVEIDKIKRSNQFSEALVNTEFKLLLGDLVDYSLRVYENEYMNRYDDTNLVLYKKYSRKNVCKLLNWDSDESGTIFGYRIKYDTCPIFVTYHKNEDINDSTKYEDAFINRNTFSWMTRTRKTFKSDDVRSILSYEENNLDIHLFVKKGDDEGIDFYYLGRAYPVLGEERETTMRNDDGKELSVVNIVYRLDKEVREDIYEYLITE